MQWTINMALLALATAVSANPTPTLEERQGADVCGRAQAIQSCPPARNGVAPFPGSGGGGCFPQCYGGYGGAHTFCQSCYNCVYGIYAAAGSGGTNNQPPVACQSLLKGQCVKNNAPCVSGGNPTKE